jgi:hypothetical protein
VAETTRTVSLLFAAELDQFKRQMAEIPNISDKQAKQAARRIETALNRAEASAKKAATSSKQAADKMGSAFKHAGEQAGDFDSAIKAVGAAVGVANPELEQAAILAGDLAGGFEGIVRIGGAAVRVLGPVAAVVGALGLAYTKLKADVDAANEAMEASAQQATEVQRNYERLQAGLAQIDLKKSLALGEITQEEFEAAQAALQAGDLFAPFQADLRKQENEIRRELDAIGRELAKAPERFESSFRGQIEQLNALLDANLAKQEALRARVAEVSSDIEKASRKVETTDPEAEAAAAAEARRAAMDAAIEVIREEVAEEQRLREEAAEEREKFERQLAENIAKHRAEVAAAAAAEEAAIQAATFETASQVAGAVGDLAGVVAQKNADAALEAYRVQQALGLTQVVINTAAAITRALAELGPVAGGIATAGIIATGAAQAAVIAAAPPPAHVGERVVGNAFGRSSPGRLSDEQDRRLLTGERVLSRSEAAAMDRPVEIRVVQQLRHRVVDEAFYRNSRTIGSRTRDALARRSGHRGS